MIVCPRHEKTQRIHREHRPSRSTRSGQATPLRDWMVKHWKYVVTNGKSLQAVHSKSCGDYALLCLKAKARGRTLQEFLNDLSDYDYESNDHKVGQRVKQLIVGNESVWHSVSKPLSSALLLIKRLLKINICVCVEGQNPKHIKGEKNGSFIRKRGRNSVGRALDLVKSLGRGFESH